VVTDINLGGEVKGWDVGRHARVVTPEIPVIYMTGNAGPRVVIPGRSQQRAADKAIRARSGRHGRRKPAE
jgi:hypothetical protein